MKVKNTKLAGVLLIIVAMVAMMIPMTTVAAPPDSGTLVIHKYVMPDKSTAGPAGTGEVTDKATVPSDAQPLDGVTFDIYKVDLTDGGAYPVSDANHPIELTDPTDPSQGFEDSTYPTAVHFDVGSTPAASITTANNATYGDGVAVAADLPQGVYLVVERGGNPDVDAPSDPFIVALPMTNADGDGYLDPVHVYPKNEKLTVEKSVETSSVAVGDSVNFTITPAVPSDLASTTGYKVTDTLDSALTFDSVTSVKAATSKAGLAAASELSSSYYDVSETGQTVTVNFTAAGLKYLADNGIRYLQIVLKATVNSEITNATHNNEVTNTASIDFTNKYGDEKTVDSDSVTIHTASIKVVKKDASSGDLLAGAEFKIASSATNAKNNEFLREDPTTGIIYDYDSTVGSKYVTLGETNDLMVSANTSADTFIGLKDFTRSGATKTPETYYLVETKAPASYNILTSPVAVTFGSNADTTPTKANNWTITITVNDNKGFLLPLTGAAGVAVFTIVGVVLVGLAIALTVNMRKKKEATVQASK